jgi:cardiolipin synthase
MTLPNWISLARLLMVPPLVYCLMTRQFSWGLAIIMIAGVSDFLDGFLARRYGWQSPLGRVLDPAADKMLLFGVLFSLAWLQAIPAWLFWIVFARDLIVSFAVIYLTRVRRVSGVVSPRLTGKMAVAYQIVLAVLTLMDLTFFMHMPLQPFFVLGAALALLSLVHYALLWRGLLLRRQQRDAVTS